MAAPGKRPIFVRELFNHTPRYCDGINRLFCFGSGNWNRRLGLRRAGLRPGQRVLDVGSGTTPLHGMSKPCVQWYRDLVSLYLGRIVPFSVAG